jgi:hypothetical protein
LAKLRVGSPPTYTQVFYLYDGMDPVVQFSSAGVVNVVNTFGANGVLARYSVNFAPSGDYERFYAYDPQGSCAEMIAGVGTSGTLLQSNTYDAFGNQTASTSAYGDAYRFAAPAAVLAASRIWVAFMFAAVMALTRSHLGWSAVSTVPKA